MPYQSVCQAPTCDTHVDRKEGSPLCEGCKQMIRNRIEEINIQESYLIYHPEDKI